MSLRLIDLCNEALDLVGASAISSLSDGTVEANIVARAYGPTRDRILRAYPWNCALRRVTLDAEAQSPPWGFAYAYALPGDCLRVVELAQGNTPWRLERRDDGQAVLLSDEGPQARLVYVRRIEDPDEFDPLLADYLVVALAERIAAKLTESPSRMQALAERARRARALAAKIDAAEGGLEGDISPAWGA